MAVFYALTPEPGQDVRPVNFGRYAYPNYPNARIGSSLDTAKKRPSTLQRHFGFYHYLRLGVASEYNTHTQGVPYSEVSLFFISKLTQCAGLISVPGSFSYNGSQARLSSSKRQNLEDLIDSANSC